MNFGLFYELSVPRPSTRESERTVYNNALEQVKLADELGFDQVWAVEHHFLEEYFHCPAPELFRRVRHGTKKIRVGHGIVVCVPVQPPHQDRRAHGGAGHPLWPRLRWARGAPPPGPSWAVSAPIPITKKSWDSFVRCLPKMWTQETYATRASSGPCPSGP